MLGFRSLFRTHDTPELLDIAQAQLAAWLKRKRYDSSLRLEPEPVEIGRGVRASMQQHTDEAGSRTIRARVVEDTPSGTWTSELTVHNSPTGNRGWVWLDIHRPDNYGWTSTPRLARQLVRALPARDGAHLLNAQSPRRAGVGRRQGRGSSDGPGTTRSRLRRRHRLRGESRPVARHGREHARRHRGSGQRLGPVAVGHRSVQLPPPAAAPGVRGLRQDVPARRRYRQRARRRATPLPDPAQRGTRAEPRAAAPVRPTRP